MEFSGLNTLQESLSQLRLILQVNENIRRHFAEDGDLTTAAQRVGALNYLSAQNIIPANLSWRIHDHSAFLTRLYALYESFVFDLIKQWLVYLPKIFPHWNDLPSKTRENYRSAIGNILHSFGGPRTEHLTELNLLEGLYAGLSGVGSYTFISDVFLIGLPNLRQGDLVKLFNKVGLQDLEKWFSNNNSSLGIFCESNEISTESQLREFINYRNDCAHSPLDQDDILGANELFILSEFIYLVCDTLSQFMLWNICQVAESQGKCIRLGNITEHLRKKEVFILTTNKIKLSVDELVIVKTGSQCFYTQIKSIQNNGTAVNLIETNDGDELGIKLSRPTKEGAELIRFNIEP